MPCCRSRLRTVCELILRNPVIPVDAAMPRSDPATRNIAIGPLQAGESQNQVARTLNVNQSTISKLWNRFQQRAKSNEQGFKI
jgi:DNA-binding NarL/FixJ family response regulator